MKSIFAVAATTVALLSTPALANTSLKFVAANEAVESQVCVAAATQGLQAADTLGKELGLNKFQTRNVVCNGRQISDFARKYKNVDAKDASVQS
ncbi:hypothetical protein K0504_04880 [Neiella marina]|uniref:DUF3718 domain-containing protein n=1 Tax=Neiella holothuriorum TaxID=2870530 RepID=A0ABS7EDH2_9GAMM|nr:hypothetical protein [Neiella holothuriorum]MBW8190363.1 hypothetical protein [Neiella holothuriorum]